TGTLWMRAVFRRLAGALGVDQHVVYPRVAKKVIPDNDRVFLFSWSSLFAEFVTSRPDARILHLIRDPRDVLLSGYRYHQHAPEKGEQFLHEPRPDLEGKTYQAHLNALPDETSKLLFEMREKHAKTVAEMLAWDYDRPNTLERRYEDLMVDTECAMFRQTLRDLGLIESEVQTGAKIFWEQSLFGGLADKDARGDRVAQHVASGQVAQWRTQLPRAVAEPYAEEFGDALVTLGYETHPTAWLAEVRHAA
ncbi:MAG: sulfotransferase domain-containing protein, partial [Pseudomonadota bacterium]